MRHRRKAKTGRSLKTVGSRTISFMVAEEDMSRLDRLADRFGGGNRSVFLREAMRHMEVIERAGRLAELQAYGAERASEEDMDRDDPVAVVRRVLKTASDD